MKKTLTILLTLLSAGLFAQNFEGEIVYANTYKSKSMMVSDAQITSMMGEKQHYFIKGGNYKSVMGAKVIDWQLYVNADNKLYSKVPGMETVYWNDAAENADQVIKSEIHKEVTTILGYKCDELVLTCKTGVQKYYFNSKLGIDAKLYSKHKFGNWYDYVVKANAVPLKMIVDTDNFSMESTATEIKPGKLDDKMFTLEPGTKTEKSPF